MYSYNTNIDNPSPALTHQEPCIPEPQLYGTFENDRHYLSTLDLLLASTRETENRHDFFLQHIFPKVASNAMIDIGIGDGKLTRLAASHFQEITMVDPSIHALESVEKNMNADKKLHKIPASIVDTVLPANQFDLAMLSHTLYYIDPDLWIDVTRNVLTSLKQDGLLVIVMNDGLDKDIAADLFGGKRLGIKDYIHQCQEQLCPGSIELFLSKEIFQSDNLSTMLHIVGLHLFDVAAVATRSELINFLKMKRNSQTFLYQFEAYQQFILIRR